MNYGFKHSDVIKHFEKVCSIPHGSGNTMLLSDYCVRFAEAKSLKYYKDEVGNVVIYKDGSFGLEQSEPVILQGHLDMVCQKTAESIINFETDALKLICDGDYLSADGTTLGADNGIAVAIILSILESDNLKHPPIEAVFTIDEEVGMIGAGKLDMSVLSGKRLINLDTEDDDTVIVSCAGGCDLYSKLSLNRVQKFGSKFTITISGLKGGHSGVEIDKGRENSNIIAGRILNYLNSDVDFDIVSINGGDKSNAIANRTVIEVITEEPTLLSEALNNCVLDIRREISAREPNFNVDVENITNPQEYSVFSESLKEDAIYSLFCAPNGVQQMSYEINGLVETSLNLGILNTTEEYLSFVFSIRSNKESALYNVVDKLKCLFGKTSAEVTLSGYYPSWEYKEVSELRSKYVSVYKSIKGEEPKIEAIHAGLECGIFASQIKDIDCIAIGPQMYDVHTVNERLKISSTDDFYDMLLKLLSSL